MKTAISMPDPLFAAAERAAKRLGISRSEFFARAVAAFLQEQNEITESLNRAHATSESTVDPTLARLQRRAVAREDW